LEWPWLLALQEAQLAAAIQASLGQVSAQQLSHSWGVMWLSACFGGYVFVAGLPAPCVDNGEPAAPGTVRSAATTDSWAARATNTSHAHLPRPGACGRRAGGTGQVISSTQPMN
jgi:hypothetical protein